jgi:MoaA/NifB/PqqE/SkfB family radical SAM enzyme
MPMNRKKTTSSKMDRRQCYEVFLNYNCNAKCLFCSQESFDKKLNAPFKEILKRILIGKKQGYSRLGVSGGEPLINPDILKIISFGKKVGFDFIRIQTNGIRLADRQFATALVKSGLTYCKFTGESHIQKTHDALVDLNGAYEKMLAGISNARDLKIRLGMNVLLNKQNIEKLPETVMFFADRGISDFVLIFPVYIGGMKTNFKRLGLSLSRAVPKIKECMRLSDAHGFDVICLNVPPCFMQDYRERAVSYDFNTKVTDVSGRQVDLDDRDSRGKLFGEACKKCVLMKKCGGANGDYVSLFGWKEFRPIKRKNGQVAKKANSKHTHFTDNERCFVQILKERNDIPTKQVLQMAKSIAMCKDCNDGNSVMVSGQKLISLGIIKRTLKRGIYYWTLLDKNINV